MAFDQRKVRGNKMFQYNFCVCTCQKGQKYEWCDSFIPHDDVCMRNIYSTNSRLGPEKSKFSEWPAEFSVISSDKSKNFLLKKFLKILQNSGAHGGSKQFMRELLPPWAPPFWIILKNFFTQKFLKLFKEYILKSAAWSEKQVQKYLFLLHKCLHA